MLRNVFVLYVLSLVVFISMTVAGGFDLEDAKVSFLKSYQLQYNNIKNSAYRPDHIGSDIVMSINPLTQKSEYYVRLLACFNDISSAREFIIANGGKVDYIFRSHMHFTFPIDKMKVLIDYKDNMTAIAVPEQTIGSCLDSSKKELNIDNNIRNNLNVIKSSGASSENPKGKNVIVGIIDAGFRVNHNTFKDTTNTTRILAYRDFSCYKPLYGTYVDTIWTQSNITNGQVISTSDIHGTHVASIAVGSGLECAPSFGFLIG